MPTTPALRCARGFVRVPDDTGEYLSAPRYNRAQPQVRNASSEAVMRTMFTVITSTNGMIGTLILTNGA